MPCLPRFGWLLTLLLAALPALASPPPVGTVISNTASASFIDAHTGLPATISSNTVATTIAPLEALTLTSSQSIQALVGTAFVMPHVLVNTGNVTTSYTLATSLGGGAGFTPSSLAIVEDLNGNGRVDPGEPVLASGTAITLTAGQSMNLLVTGTVPASALAGQSVRIVLTATSSVQGATAADTDTVTAESATAQLAVTLSTPTSTSQPGSGIALQSVGTNVGGASASPVPITLNGQVQSLVLVTLPVPANTVFAGAQSSSAGAQTLLHVLGAAPSAFVSAVSAGATVDAVAWGVPSLAPGASLSGVLDATVNANATTSLTAQANASWAATGGGAPSTSVSNVVTITLPVVPASITYYTGSNFSTPTSMGVPGGPLFIQLNAAACNVDPTQTLIVTLTVISQLTGDTEHFTATETGPNTGLFRVLPDVPTASALNHAVVSGDGVLELLSNDVVTATLQSCAGASARTSAALPIQPMGVVFDSHTNQPVAGVTVTLIDVTGAGNGGQAGGQAHVFQADGVTPAPAAVVTGSNGGYSFLQIPPGSYRIVVTTPGGYQFPSKLSPAQQPAGRLIDPAGSYGQTFTVAGPNDGTVHFDVPVDEYTGGTALLVQKSADKLTAELGDAVGYSVQVNNVSTLTLADTRVIDALPAGFTYIAGSARLNGIAIADPHGAGGPQLQFALGTLLPGAQPLLTYRVRVGPGAEGGNGINTAQALSGTLTSNRASVGVQVVGGVFDQKAYLIGKVFADCNANRVQDAGEPGVPGVRIYLEDGTYAVTDEEGKYSLYGLVPRMHVAKVDATTLPAGTALEVLNHRNALDPASAFVDLTNGELHKSDFAIAGCPAPLLRDLTARRSALKHPTEVLEAGALLWSQTTPSTNTIDARSLPAAGVIRLPGSAEGASGAAAAPMTATLSSGMPGITPFATPALKLGAAGDVGGTWQAPALPLVVPLDPLGSAEADAPGDGAGRVSPEDGVLRDHTRVRDERLETLMPHLDNSVGFVNLEDGQMLPVTQTRVQVKGPTGTHFVLLVNGQRVPESQVGRRSSLGINRLVVWEYIGVDLSAGRNVIQVQALDDFGNLHATRSVTVLAPGDVARILIEAPARAIANPNAPVPVTVSLRDANGVTVAARTALTLGAQLGHWQAPAGSSATLGAAGPGQVMVSGGTAHLLLLPPAQPGKDEITVSAGQIKANAVIEFMPNLRPLLAVGLVSGSLNLRNLNASALQPAQSSDVFEREIQNVSRSLDGGKDDVAAQSALFLKGKVLGSTLLTLAYDSDKPSDTTLFRDIQPDQFYPVYGDSSARGYDAQSTGKLYVMVQNGTNYALYGDYTTQTDNPARQLTQYSRALNGVKEHWQLGRASVDGFASHTSTTQSIVEFRANGTSGPFQLDLHGVANSQQVDIITRDRNQPAVILSDTVLTPFTDYEIEPYTGLLLLKNPVPSVDQALNPIYIHVSYSLDEGGPRHWVEGADANVKLGSLTVGATAIHDADPANELTLEGVDTQWKLDAHTVGTAELARSVTTLLDAGTGERLDLQHTGGAFELHLWGVHTDKDFYNPNSLQSAGESQYGIKGAYKIDAKDRLVIEALKTSNSESGAQQSGAEVKLERALPRSAKLELGVRHSSQNAESALAAPTLPGLATTLAPIVPPTSTGAGTSPDVGYTSARAKLSSPVPGVKGAEVYGLAEDAVDGSGGKEIGVGGTYALNASTRLYAQHDFINSLNGPYTLNPSVSQYSTVAGITSTLPDSTQLFDEYRVGDGLDGRTSEAAVGLRRQWKLTDGLGLSAGLQRITPFSGTVTDTSSAITLGAGYTAKDAWKASAQAQWQTSTASHSWLFSAGLARKLDVDWTVLERALYSDQTGISGGGGRELARLQSGIAYRPVDSDRWNALGQLEYKRDFDTTLGQGLALDEQAWIGAGNLNLQLSAGWDASARVAVKRALDWAGGGATHTMTELAGARSTWDLARRWDAGVQAYRLWGEGSAEDAVGVQVGYLVWKNLWLSLGYNVKGFSAPDLAGESYTQRGIYLHLDFKFDEALFAGDPLAARTQRAPGRSP